MKTIETVGKDIEQALLSGLAELGCKLDDVEVKILEHPGIFRKARVRMTYNGDDGTVEKKTAAGVMRNLEERASRDGEVRGRDRRDRRRDDRRPAQETKQRPDAQAEKKPQPADRRPERTRENAQPRRDDRDRQSRPATAGPSEKPAKKEFARDFRAELLQEQSGAKPDKAEKPAKQAADNAGRKEKQEKQQPRQAAERVREPIAPEIVAAVESRAASYLKEVVRLMGVESDIVSEIAGDEINMKLTAESETLIGYRGEGIEALEHLATVTANADGERVVHINLDCGSYRAQRDEALAAMANSRADKAVATGRRVDLEPMSSAGRKVVHAALAARDDVITRSEGREPDRHIVIIPRHAQQGGRRNYGKNRKYRNNGHGGKGSGGKESE